jgi:solute carrier family 25 aspartate/glutamate transporter 12/13
MLPNLPLPRIFPNTLHLDAAESGSGSGVSSIKQSLKSAVSVRETELQKWKRTFDTNAKEVNGQK